MVGCGDLRKHGGRVSVPSKRHKHYQNASNTSPNSQITTPNYLNTTWSVLAGRQVLDNAFDPNSPAEPEKEEKPVVVDGEEKIEVRRGRLEDAVGGV